MDRWIPEWLFRCRPFISVPFSGVFYLCKKNVYFAIIFLPLPTGTWIYVYFYSLCRCLVPSSASGHTQCGVQSWLKSPHHQFKCRYHLMASCIKVRTRHAEAPFVVRHSASPLLTMKLVGQSHSYTFLLKLGEWFTFWSKLGCSSRSLVCFSNPTEL